MTNLREAVRQVKTQRDDISTIRTLVVTKYPFTVKALRMIDLENSTPRRGKGFCLGKRENKKHGFVYYVRYYHEGKMLPTKWSTGTNDPEKAERFARNNRVQLIEMYQGTRNTRMYDFLERFYTTGVESEAAHKCSRVSVRVQREYNTIIKNKFVPFLKKERINDFAQITAVTLDNFQDFVLGLGARPQTVNNNMNAVKKILAYLARKEIMKENPARFIRRVPVRRTDLSPRGCYELERLNGVFGERWENERSYLLILLIYTTGMRNCEIRRLRMEDILTIEDCRFVSVKESKTVNGIRLVPLHDFVYGKLEELSAGGGKGVPPFGFGSEDFGRANRDLAARLGADEGEVERENITFYSGRHFWKTLMCREGLGEDIEEIFMGHKVSGNVAKLYNHRDRYGKALLVRKAREVFSILDRCVFAGPG